MPGRVKTAPAGAIMACADGRVYAGCEPCGEGCPTFSLYPSGAAIQANLVRYTTGVVQESGGSLVPTGYYGLYWGEPKPLDDASDFCDAALFTTAGDMYADTIRVTSSAPAPQHVSATPDPAELRPLGFFETRLASVTVGRSGSTRYAGVYVDPMKPLDELYEQTESGQRFGTTLSVSSDYLVDGETCLPEGFPVNITVQKQEALATPGAIALTVNYRDSGGEKAVRARYFVTDITFTSEDPVESVDYLYTADPDFPAQPFIDRFGGMGSFTVSMSFSTGTMAITSITFNGGGSTANFLTDSSIVSAASAGFPVGASTSYAGGNFFVAAFGFCPSFPAPRVRAASGYGWSFRGGVEAGNSVDPPDCTYVADFNLRIRAGGSSVTSDYHDIPFNGWDSDDRCASYLLLDPFPGQAPLGSPGSVGVYMRKAHYLFGAGLRYGTTTWPIGSVSVPDIMHPDTILHVPLAATVGTEGEAESSGGFVLTSREPELLN